MLQQFTTTFWQTLKEDLVTNPNSVYAQEIKFLNYGQEVSDFAVDSLLENFAFKTQFNLEYDFNSDPDRIKLYLKKFPYFEAKNFSKTKSKFLLEDLFFRYNQQTLTEFNQTNPLSPVAAMKPTSSTTPFISPTNFQTEIPDLNLPNFNSQVGQTEIESETDQQPNLTEQTQNSEDTLSTTELDRTSQTQNLKDDIEINFRNESNFDLQIPIEDSQTQQNSNTNAANSIQSAKLRLQVQQQERQRKLQVQQIINQQQLQQQLANRERNLKVQQQQKQKSQTKQKNNPTKKILLAAGGVTAATGSSVFGITLFFT